MDNAQGKKIYYGIVLDNAQLRQDAEQSKNIFRGIGDASTASASRIDSAYKSVSGTLMKLGAAVSAVELAKGIYNFADRFERSMAEVTTISETVTNDLGKFKQEIIEMSTEIPVPADEAAKALYQIVSAGHDGAAGLEVLRVSAKAAVGGVTETVTAADAITSILNAYKKGAGEAENISDQLFTTVRLGKTTMGELGHSISQAIPIAASFGIESEQVLAAIATLTKSGTPTAQAVTQVRSAVKAASEQLGDGYFKTHTFQQGLQEIAKKAGGSEAKLRALVPEIEAMNGILGLTGINAQTAASDLDELMNSAGATEAAFQKMASETSSQLTILKNNVLAEFSELGESMVENVGKVAAALNEAFDTGKIDEMLSVLGTLIAMYGTYKATLIATAAIRESVETVKHTEEAAELYKLLTAEQQAQISKKGLAKTSAEYYAMVKAETAASVQAAQSALTKARADVTASNQAVAARRAEYIAAKQLEAQRLTELTAISATGTAKQTEAAQRKLAAAETQRESAAIAFQSATRDFNTKKTAVETAARTANTTATAVNTAAQTANATATGFLTVAKTRLAAVAARLNAVIMANPYALAAAAAVAFGYGLYKLITYQTEAEKAQKRFNEATEEFEKSSTSEIAVLNIMFSRLNKAKEGTDEYRAAKEAIQKKYGDYLSKMGDEVRLLKDTTLAQKELTTAILETARARAQEKFIQQESDAASEKQVAALRQIREKLIKEKGENVGEAIYGQIKSMLVAYQNDPQDRDGKKYTEYVKLLRENGLGDDIGYGRLFTSAYGEYVNSVQRLLKAQQDADAYFGAPQSNEEDQTTFDATTTSLQQLMTRLPKVREELAALKNAEKPDAAAIAAKEQEIKQIKDQTEARERELSVIKDVKAQIEALQKQQLDYGKDDEEYKSLEARIKYLKTKLPLTDGQIGKTVSRQSKYDEQIRQEAIQRQRAEEDLEFSVQQARIDAMKDGIDKVLAQNELNHKRELLDIERQKQDLLKAIQEQERTIWEAKNPDWEKKGLKFTPTVTKLPTETLEKFDKLLETAKNKKQKSDVDYLTAQFDQEVVDWNEYYKKYGTFRERLQATKDEYDQKMQEAKNTGEKAALQTEMDEVLAEFEVEASGFVEELTNKTTGKLETMLKNAQKQLEVVRKKFKALDSSTSIEAKQYKDTINKLEAQIKVLQNQLSKAKETASDKDWAQSAELFQAISSGARDAAEGVRDFDEGLADVLTTIANITAGIGGMIAAITAIGAAVSAAEKASAILAVIAAAIQIVSGLFSIFSGGESAVEKTCREFAELNDELIRLKREAAINSWEDTIFGADEWKNASENMKIYVEAFERYNNTLEDIRKRGQEVYVDFHGRNSDWVVTEKANLDKMAKTWETAAQSIFNMQVQTRHSTWFRSAKYASLGSLLPGIFNEDGTLNMDALKEFQGNDLYKKLTKENRAFIDALISDWELYEEALDEVKGYLSDIFGDLGETITDVLVDAFANGTDAAKGFADSVSEMLENLAKDMIYSVTLAPLMEKAQKDILAIMGDAGLSDDQKFEKYAGVLAYLTDEALAQQENANYLMKLYQEMAAQKGIDIFQPDGEREASSKGIATASQDSVEELNGRFTVIQSHTFDIREAVNAIAASKTQDLMKIEINTERLHTIDANVFGIREASNLLVANSARMLQHLAGIEDNTSNLHAMRDDLSGIRNELRAELSSVGHAVSDMILKGLKLKR